MQKLLPGMFLLLFVLAAACKKDPACDSSNVTYTNTVKALFNQSCALSGCHESGSVNGSLASYTDAIQMAANGRIVGSLQHSAGYSAMPQSGGMLDDCTINKVAAWINSGMPN